MQKFTIYQLIYAINELVSSKKFTNAKSLLSSGLLLPGLDVSEWQQRQGALGFRESMDFLVCVYKDFMEFMEVKLSSLGDAKLRNPQIENPNNGPKRNACNE